MCTLSLFAGMVSAEFGTGWQYIFEFLIFIIPTNSWIILIDYIIFFYDLEQAENDFVEI